MKLKTFIKTASASSALYFGVAMTSVCFASMQAHAAEPVQPVVTAAAFTQTTAPQSFVKKSFGIQGQWQIVEENGQRILRLSDDFKTKRGPDLKIFLSPKSISDVTGRTATENAIKLGELKSNKGGQDYIIPDHINLANFSSVLIHCEAFSKLWGGNNLR